MSTLTAAPGAVRVLTSSIVARLPLPMLGIGLLVHAEHLTGSYAVAGLVTAAYAIATAIGGPALGRLVDRRGQTAVLMAAATAAAGLLAAVAALPHGAAPGLLVALAAAVGLTTPPAGACARALLPDLCGDREATRVAYAIDATAVELTWVAGPPLALATGLLWSTGAAVALAGAILLLGTAAFAAQPASRAWRPADHAAGRRGALRAPGLQTLVLVLVAVGVLFGAVEVAVTATAEHLSRDAAAGPLLGVWGLGSLLGGILTTRLGGGAHTAAGLTWMLAALAAGHLALAVAAGSLIALAAVLLVAGAAIAPTYAAVYAMVERVAPAGTATEAFAWLATAAAGGSAAGAALAGALAEHSGATVTFLLAAAAGAVALLAAALRGNTLSPAARPARVAAATA
jgi:MFS family permease